MDLGDTCLLQFKHERLLRWLAYMKVNNTEVGEFSECCFPDTNQYHMDIFT